MEKEVLDDKKSGVLRKSLIILVACVLSVSYGVTLWLTSLPAGEISVPFGNREMAIVTALGGVVMILLAELINWRFGLGSWHYFYIHAKATLIFMGSLSAATVWHIAGMFQSPDTQIIFVWTPIVVVGFSLTIAVYMGGSAMNKPYQRDEQSRSSSKKE